MKSIELPGSKEVEKELDRVKYKRRYRKAMKNTIYALITASAAAILVATLFLPVLRIYGSSMNPTLEEGQIVVSYKDNELEVGDIVAFFYGNKVLIKRYIAGPGDWVDINEDGEISVNGVYLDEPYIEKKHFGISDLEYPYQVPEGTNFLIGDHRETSVDSRHSTVGCIADEEIIGRVIFRVWPMDTLGVVK